MLRQTIDFAKWLRYQREFSLVLLCLLSHSVFANNEWRVLAPGIEYQDLKTHFLTPWSHLHVFRIDLQLNQLALVSASDLLRKHASVNEYALHSKALLTINGGFFDNNFQPLGLRIDRKKLKTPFKKISWWGVFYIKNQDPYIVSALQFKANQQIEFAIQSGPRLLINRRIPSLKPGRAERTALGITSNNKLIMLVTDNLPLSTTELAHLMKASPLNCRNALNLDGGSSSQLHASISTFQLDVHGFSNVSDAIIVKAK